MSNKRKTLIWFLMGIGFMMVCSFSYRYLSERSPAEISAEIPAEIPAALPAETTAPEEESIAPDETEENNENNETKKVKAPDFTVVDADGNEVKLSDFLGTPVVLNFWASWCPPCKLEMPDFDKVHGELGESVSFMMVNMTDGMRETVDDGKSYIAEEGFTFPVYFDTNSEAAYGYGVSSIPTTLFIDKDGYVVTGAQGAINEETLRKGIKLVQVE